MTDEDQRTLAALADAIIPPSEKHGAPGAGDPAICAAIVGDARRRLPRLEAALAKLNALADETSGGRFVDLPLADRSAVALVFREAHAADAEMIQALVAQCYYRDERVMRSLGMAPRPPHPVGYEVEHGDWSLLDPVRRRDGFYRKAD